MIQFTKAIYIDLLSRIRKMIDRIQQGNYHEDIRDEFVIVTLESLRNLESGLEAIINSGDLDIELLLANNLSNYSKYNQDLGYIELYRIQPINNYGKGEHYFKKLVEKVYDDSNILSTPPLVSTISNSDYYYWAFPNENIIAVPFWEEENLINLPDLFHEIGHLIIGQYYNTIISGFIKDFEKYFQYEISLAYDENRRDDVRVLETSKVYWLDSWFEEFVCDLIATYLTGPAFAWTNMKLTTISYSKAQVYYSSKSHPADEARTRAIIFMLNKIGSSQESENVLVSWKTFEQLINYPKIHSYDIIFSDDLLKILTEKIYKFCQDIDLQIFTPYSNNKDKTIAQLLNEAWDVSRNTEIDFPIWEKDSIKQLEKILNV